MPDPKPLIGSPAPAHPVDAWAGEFNNVFRDGRLYFAGQPTRRGLALASEAGVKTLISLRPAGEKIPYDEPAAPQEAGLAFERVAVDGADLQPKHVDQLHEVLERAAERHGDVMIHCGSSNRVGGLWAAYLALKRGVDPDKAMELGRAAGLTNPKLESRVREVIAEGASR